MAEERKSAYKHALEAAGRFKRQVDKVKEQGEMIAEETLRTAIGAGAAFTVGFVNQRFGQADAETGIRVHKINGAPTGLLVGAGLKVASGFGVAGKFQAVGFSAGQGAVDCAASDWGRMAGERWRRKEAATPATEATGKAAPQVTAKPETATVNAAVEVQPEAVKAA